jgi:hypothetical protein
MDGLHITVPQRAPVKRCHSDLTESFQKWDTRTIFSRWDGVFQAVGVMLPLADGLCRYNFGRAIGRELVERFQMAGSASYVCPQRVL